MTRIILVRHGSTEWNETGRRQGHTDVPLSDLGRAQARSLGARLADESIDLTLCSDLQRALETAHAVIGARDVPLQIDPRLRECCFGSWEGLRHDEIAVRYPAAWDAWTKDPITASPTGGESFGEVASRVCSAIVEVTGFPIGGHPSPSMPPGWPAAPNSPHARTILVVTHGAAIAILLTQLLGLELARYWQFAIRPASVSLLDLYAEGAIAATIGDTYHLSRPGLIQP